MTSHSDHICGHPNAMCDAECMERAHMAETIRDLTAIAEAAERLLRFLRVSINAGPMSSNPRREVLHLESLRLAIKRWRDTDRV